MSELLVEQSGNLNPDDKVNDNNGQACGISFYVVPAETVV